MAVITGAGDDSTVPVVLLIAFPDSVHTARWVNMVREHMRIVLLPVYVAPVNAECRGVRTIADRADIERMCAGEVGVFDLDSTPEDELAAVDFTAPGEVWRPEWLRARKFARTGHVISAIRRLRPDLAHSMVVQHGGYLAFGARQRLRDEFPAWLLSNWGSDIFLFRKTEEHLPRIREILPCLDGYHAECERDVRMARQLGFRGLEFPALPASGGMRFADFPALDTFQRPSRRRDIYIKGYHGWAGRGLHTLAAVHLAADALRGYTIRLELAPEPVREMAKEVAHKDALDIVVEPYLPNHRDVLLRLAKCRFVAGLSIADGISTTLLEAMAVGAFPIQGCGSCGNEWIVSGESGILVSPDDVRALADAMRRAATDDAIVDAAAERNRKVIEARWDADRNSSIATEYYRKLIDRARERGSVARQQYGTELIHG